MTDKDPTLPGVASDPLGLKPGEIFWNHYRVVGLIGKGGVSTVYKAEHVQNQQLVAIKLLHAQKSRDEELVRRFVREAQTTSKLDHPHAIHIYEWGIDQHGRPFMIIEYLSGETLARRIHRTGGMHYQKAVEIMEQICAAVGEAHSMGIIHRDLKPENIMLTTHNGLEDFVKVVDFGIAKLENPEGEDVMHQASLTKTGAILGTPMYMSPEQLRGRKADARSDIYSLGVILYEMLTGKPPFCSKNTAEIVVGHLNVVPEAPPRVRMDLSIPESVSEAAMRALSKNPWERPTTVQEFLSGLHKALDRAGKKKHTSEMRRDRAASAEQPAPVTTPTPQGMVIDPVRRVCPQCKTVSSGANFRYCLKCGQDNTNKWLPYHQQDSQKLGAIQINVGNVRKVAVLVVVALGLAWAAHAYFSKPFELTGKFTGSLDHELFRDNPDMPPEMGLKEVKMFVAQHGEVVDGLLLTRFGQTPLKGKVTHINPLIMSYELESSISRPSGRLDLELAGTFDRIFRQEQWNLKAFFHGPKEETVDDSARMTLAQLKESSAQ